MEQPRIKPALFRSERLEADVLLPSFRLDTVNSTAAVDIAEGGLNILLFKNFLAAELAEVVFERLLNGLIWHRVLYKKYGKQFETPRYMTVFGEDDNVQDGKYNYPLSPISEGLKNLLEVVKQVASNDFNFMLFNLYLDNTQAISYHSDDESFFSPDPTIASLSLGAGRKFQLRKKSDPRIKHEFFLESGDLLIMPGRTQHDWEHAIPKSGKPARINITFRRAINTAGTNNYYRYNRYGDDYKPFTFQHGNMVPL